MRRRAAIAAALFLAPALLAGQAATAPPSVEAKLRFLETAKVTDTRVIGKGITGALRVTLTDGRLTHDAAFQSIAEENSLENRARGRKKAGEVDFVDHYRYNIGAWRLATLLGLGAMMPPTVERTVAGKPGALSWWVDDVLMDEAEREKANAAPPSALALVRQRQRMEVFAQLVRDTDRNKGNVLYTKTWQLVMLDFSRAFRLQPELRNPESLVVCDRALLARLRTLKAAEVARAADPYLSAPEVDAIMARRDRIVARFDRLIAERGEAVVLY